VEECVLNGGLGGSFTFSSHVFISSPIFGSYFHTTETNVLIGSGHTTGMGGGGANKFQYFLLVVLRFHNGRSLNGGVVSQVALLGDLNGVASLAAHFNLVTEESVESIVSLAIGHSRLLRGLSTSRRVDTLVTTVKVGGVLHLDWGNGFDEAGLLAVGVDGLLNGPFVLLTLLHVVDTALGNRLLGTLRHLAG
jgi:hypothetical protein